MAMNLKCTRHKLRGHESIMGHASPSLGTRITSAITLGPCSIMIAHCVTCMLVFTRYCNFREKGINTVKTPASVAVEFVYAYVINHLPPNDIYIYIYIYRSYRTANLQTLHFKYLVNKYPY
jgi:hypothetical protein